jgi:pimeloyl-ACP methyl ester carboxylesterase
MNMIAAMDWRTRALAAYQWTRGQALDRMRGEVAAQIHRLTGQAVEPEAISVDRDAHIAWVTIDGVCFQAHGRRLVVVRPCVRCRARHLESAAIADEADLGHALWVWEPRCQNCAVEASARGIGGDTPGATTAPR